MSSADNRPVTPSGAVNPETPAPQFRILSKRSIHNFISRCITPKPAAWGEILLEMQALGLYDPQRDVVRVNDDTSDLWVGDVEIPYRIQLDGIKSALRYATHGFWVGVALRDQGEARPTPW